MGVRHFQVKTEHLVKADLETGNTNSLLLFRLIPRYPLFAPAGQLSQFIERPVKSIANDPALARRKGTLLVQGRAQLCVKFLA